MPTSREIYSINIIICHACPVRQRPCAGPCACKDGVDIILHAKAGACPLGKFDKAGQITRVWPWWARLLRLCRSHGERGVGDTWHRLLGPMGEGYEAAYLYFKGKMCGCCSRLNRLNGQFPYLLKKTHSK